MASLLNWLTWKWMQKAIELLFKLNGNECMCQTPKKRIPWKKFWKRLHFSVIGWISLGQKGLNFLMGSKCIVRLKWEYPNFFNAFIKDSFNCSGIRFLNVSEKIPQNVFDALVSFLLIAWFWCSFSTYISELNLTHIVEYFRRTGLVKNWI